jgi:hypothetical protein
MTIWMEEELFAEEAESGFEGKGITESVGAFVRIYEPRVKALTSPEISSIDFTKPDHHYALVKLGCELDPGNEARRLKAGFSTARVSVPVWGDGKAYTRIFSLFPTSLKEGSPQTVKLKLEPSVEIASLVKVGVGSLETDILVGQVAPSTIGFKGDHEMRPYWNLQHVNQAPIYGMRDFWLLLEAPRAANHCFISCFIATTLQTTVGPIHLGPKNKDITHRPRYRIDF